MIEQFVPSEVCLKCIGCCRFSEANSVWLPCLLDEEIQDLLDKKIPPVSISIDKKIQPIPNPRLVESAFICAFLDASANKCAIYDFRPLECQLYPFLIAIRDKKVLLTVDLNCPYIKDKMSSREFEEYVRYLTDFLNAPARIRLLRDNPHIIQAYKDALDVVELKMPDETK
ncbi:MAG: YkgJ family cysteine cluster protein [Candidatus Omnitrophota bacterium]|nr:YkgJ family cysteine cluster protein [Candidatus Omnitrophota bacterium]